MPLGYVDGYIVDVPDSGTATITAGNDAGSTSPVLILGYETNREGQNVIHDLIGGGIAVSLIRPRLRSGNLELFYPSEASAWTALEMHGEETTFTLSDSVRPAIGMVYVLSGAARLTLDPETRDLWVVTIPYQEVEL